MRRGRHAARPSVLSAVHRSTASLLPGLLAWRAGARWLAVAIATATTTAVGGTLLLGAQTGGFIEALVDAQVLRTLVALNLVFVGVRSVEVAVAWRHWKQAEAGPTRPTATPATVGLPRTLSPPPAPRRQQVSRARRHAARERAIAGAVSLALVVSPHLLVAHQFDLVRTSLDDIFVGPSSTSAEAADPPPGSEERPMALRLAAANGEREPTADPASGPVGSSSAEADGLYTVLLIGLDAGAGREGARNDANLIVTVDPVTGTAALIGIPRNFVRMPLPGADDECDCFREPLFALYGYGWEHADRYPGSLDPGAEAVRGSVAALIGREVDHYLVADLGAFLDLVDALGGVTVTVDQALTDSKSDPWDVHASVTVDLGPGTHRLDGGEALSYVRSRHDSDYGRMARQRCVVAALKEPVSGLTTLAALDLLGSVRGRIVTDIPRGEVAVVLQLARRVDRHDVRSVGLIPPTFVAARWDGYPEPDAAAIRRAVSGLPADEPVPEDCAP